MAVEIIDALLSASVALEVPSCGEVGVRPVEGVAYTLSVANEVVGVLAVEPVSNTVSIPSENPTGGAPMLDTRPRVGIVPSELPRTPNPMLRRGGVWS